MSLGGSRFEALPSWLTGTATIAVIMSTQVTAAVAMTPKEINRIAAPVTVQINNNVDAGGSGVIIARKGDTYTVLTVSHVVKRPVTYTIRTNKGNYQVKSVQRLQQSEIGLDLAVVTFDSPDNYPTATLGNSEQAEIGVAIYISGYPALEGEKGAERDYVFSQGIVTSRPTSHPLGYTLRYNAVTVSGMSGGPVFDANGRVVGIHGLGESQGSVQSDLGGTIPIKTGFNSAIPINTFVALRSNGLSSHVGVNNTNHQTHQAQLSSPTAERSNPRSYHLDLGSRQVGLENFKHSLQLSPNDAQAYYKLGQNKYSLGDKQGAIKDYTQAIRFYPKFSLAYNSLGQAHYDLGDKQEAIKDYAQAIRFSPKFALAYNNLGRAHYDLGNKQQAIRDYTQAIQSYPEYATAYYNRGVVRYDLGDKQGAIKDYTQAIRLNHNYTLAYYKRGVVYYNLGNKQGALNDFQQAANIYQQEGNRVEYQQMLVRIKKLRSERVTQTVY